MTLVRGSIDLIQGNLAHGWLYGASASLRPVLLAGGRSAVLLDAAVPRPDVCAALGISPEAKPGFICKLPQARAGVALELYGVDHDSSSLVASRILEQPVCETGMIPQIMAASRVCGAGNAVGIVCWEARPSSLLRAAELYEIASERYPAVLLYLANPEFEAKLWAPLQNWPGCLVGIPWSKRQLAFQLLAVWNVTFNTVWISGPEPRAFQLACAVAKPDTRYILDINDWRDAAMLDGAGESKNADRGLASFISGQISARTVRGRALKEHFGGEIVRHSGHGPNCEIADSDGLIRIGCIAAIESGKNLLELGRSIALIAKDTRLPLRLDLFGEINDPGLAAEMQNLGANLHGPVSLAGVASIISGMRAIIAGFCPEENGSDSLLRAKYHVAPAIAWALAAGKPVLAANTEALAEFAHTQGIYLFAKKNFAEKLIEALAAKSISSLPEDFSLQGAAMAFEKALSEARPCASLSYLAPGPGRTPDPVPATVLIWKQPDAGLYGRRVDQIARALKRRLPDQRVFIVEFYGDARDGRSGIGSASLIDEKDLREQWIWQKRHGTRQDGISYKLLPVSPGSAMREEFEYFLISQNLMPENTRFILFPYIHGLENIADLLESYPAIIDIVDNDLRWPGDNALRARIFEQYFMLSAMAEHAVFNSAQNRAWFIENFRHIEGRTSLIPNWYALPDGVRPKPARSVDGCRQIVYSGNLNDRIDWKTLALAAAQPGVTLHLAGTSEKVQDELGLLLKCGAIYHGVLSERQTLALLDQMDAAIVAHKRNQVSRFMDPMKVKMYEALGLAVLLPEWLAQPGYPWAYANAEQSMQLIKELPGRGMIRGEEENEGLEYARLVGMEMTSELYDS